MNDSPLLQRAKNGHDILLGGGQYKRRESDSEFVFALSVVDLTARRQDLVPLDFLAHGVAVDPNDRHRIVVCEKIGPGAALIDLQSLSVTGKLQTTDDRLFYGHCAFSSDGKLIYTTETYKASHDGAIVIRDAGSLEIVGEFPSFGAAPHECLLIDDGKTMVVTNGGGDISGPAPNVAYIDIATQSLVKREHPTNRHLNTGHLAIADDDGSLVVVSAPRAGTKEPKLGGVSIQPAGKNLRSVTLPKKVVSRMAGEALSVQIMDGTAAVTHPDGEMVTFWNISDRRLVKEMTLPKPRGVTMSRDNKRLVISYNHDASLMQLDAETLEPVSGSVYSRSFVTGSHLYNWTTLATTG